MSKKEACEFLGKSPRTVADYMATGKLAVRYVNGRNGRQAVFAREDVERLKRDFDTPDVRAVAAAPPDGSGTVLSLATRPAPNVDSLAALFARLAPPAAATRPWLTLDEASAFSGLPKSFLLATARDPQSGAGDYVATCVVALNVGSEKRVSWRFSRAALEGAGR
jgi:hypothetical protein